MKLGRKLMNGWWQKLLFALQIPGAMKHTTTTSA